MSKALNMALYGVPFDFGSGVVYPVGAFVVDVDSTLQTDGNTTADQFGPYFINAFDVTIDWGDGTTSSHSGSNAQIIHDYGAGNGGEYEVQVTDNGSSGFSMGTFNNSLGTKPARDSNCYLDIKQWGDYVVPSNNHPFGLCSNIGDISATDTPNIATSSSSVFAYLDGLISLPANFADYWTALDDISQAFRNLTSLVLGSPITIASTGADFLATYAFSNLSSLNIIPSSSTCTSCASMALNLGPINNTTWLDWFVGLDFSGLTSAANAFSGCTVQTAGTDYYAAILNKWISDGLTSAGLSTNFGSTVRTAAAQTAITTLKGGGWTGSDASGAW